MSKTKPYHFIVESREPYQVRTEWGEHYEYTPWKQHTTTKFKSHKDAEGYIMFRPDWEAILEFRIVQKFNE